ncbi:polyprenyl synthetase family protein [Lihuaxuella thermophila]|uniref:Farnesyl diphosphate synthase n=1 Tax=Lihuaxuella thermophila TaxID=1173111 RepID=A0A1H8ESD8_9BACL|nr:farnesyl diphosphate synthase [Lihuaxuella thermophila]SEN22405.1 geranylgeranyl diphosphate synthase, type II [Lihuaxuella thermophila]
MVSIQDYIQTKAKWVHQALDQYTREMTGIPEILLESMRYSLLAGGKRLRPVLVLATAEACGGDAEKALPFACALEMIHTYSLIHDDLPCMDNDDFRRGKPTNHKVFGDAQAILAGDALLTEAFGLMAAGAKQAGLSAGTALTIIEEASRCAGAKGMVGGQVSDLLSENRTITLEELESIHRRKTGDLIAFAVRTGARLAGASDGLLSALTRFAYGLGLAFQIQDDILDVIGDQHLIGKPVGSDQARNKATYPALLGLEASKQKLREVTDAAKAELLGHDPFHPNRLLEIADYLLTRDR